MKNENRLEYKLLFDPTYLICRIPGITPNADGVYAVSKRLNGI